MSNIPAARVRLPDPTEPPEKLHQALERYLSDIHLQLRLQSEGRAASWTTSGTTPPRAGQWAAGDTCRNTAPVVITDDNLGSYVVEGWLCVETGEPGTWVARKIPVVYYGDTPAPSPTPPPSPTPTPTPAPSPIFDATFDVSLSGFTGYNATVAIQASDWLRVTNTTLGYGSAYREITVTPGSYYQILWDATVGSATSSPSLHVGDENAWNQYFQSTTDRTLGFTAVGSILKIQFNTDSADSGVYHDYDFVTVTPEVGAPAPSPGPSPSPAPAGVDPPEGINFTASASAVASAYLDMSQLSDDTSNKLGTYMNPDPYVNIGSYTALSDACANYPLGTPTYLPAEWDAVVPWFWVKPLAGHSDSSNTYVQCGLCSVQIHNGTSWEYLFGYRSLYGKVAGENDGTSGGNVPEILRNGLLVVDVNNRDVELWPKEYTVGGEAFFVNPNKTLLASCNAIYIELAARVVKADLNGPAPSSGTISGVLGFDPYTTINTGTTSLRQASFWTWGVDGRCMDGAQARNKRITTDWQRWSLMTVTPYAGPSDGKPPPWSGTSGWAGVWTYADCESYSWWESNPPTIMEIPTDWDPAANGWSAP